MSLLISVICYLLLEANGERFENYRTFHVHIDNAKQSRAIKYLHRIEDKGLKFWKQSTYVGETTDIMVSPLRIDEIKSYLRSYKFHIERNESINNVQDLIDNIKFEERSKEMDWKSYHSIEEINYWLYKVVREHPDRASLFTVGRSYEGNHILGVKISHKTNNSVIFIDSNMHGREWITSAATTYLINNLLNSVDDRFLNLANQYDWYIVPILNPDGFIYSHTENRLWHKTRKPHGKDCFGVDLNRNFDYYWTDIGPASSPCSDMFAGPEPNSEPETQALIQFLNKINKIHLYLSIQAYGQMVISPYRRSVSLRGISHYKDEDEIADGFTAAATLPFNTIYKAKLQHLLESASSRDWAHGILNVPLSYTIELRDRGQYGFLIPPEDIVEASEEFVEGIIGMVAAAKNRQYL